MQYLVVDPGYDSDGTAPCGLSGNPLRLGTGVDNLRSCFGGTDWIQWGIIAHEMGHNFMNQIPFQNFLAGLPNQGTYSEGITTMLGIYAIDELVAHPEQYGLTTSTVNNLSRRHIPLTPNFARSIFYNKLAVYEQNRDYVNDFDADILDGIMTKLHDEYGSTNPASLYVGLLPGGKTAFDQLQQRDADDYLLRGRMQRSGEKGSEGTIPRPMGISAG